MNHDISWWWDEERKIFNVTIEGNLVGFIRLCTVLKKEQWLNKMLCCVYGKFNDEGEMTLYMNAKIQLVTAMTVDNVEKVLSNVTVGCGIILRVSPCPVKDKCLEKDIFTRRMRKNISIQLPHYVIS